MPNEMPHRAALGGEPAPSTAEARREEAQAQEEEGHEVAPGAARDHTAPALRYMSLGAGRQSTALFGLAARGQWGAHGPALAIVADTQDEPHDFYLHLERLAGVEWQRCHDDRGRVFYRVVPGIYRGGLLGAALPVHAVTVGRLSASVLNPYGAAGAPLFAGPPLYARNPSGEPAVLRRQCTREFKIAAIEREVRRVLLEQGHADVRMRRVRGGGDDPRPHVHVRPGVWVESWQGISRDEATRMKDSRTAWVRNRYPLVMELGWTADDCVRYNERHGHGAAKSACVFCPYTDDARWRDMKANRPEDFARAVEFDHALRAGGCRLKGVQSDTYVHRSLRPLDEVDFSNAEDRGQVNMFENECEGMCGV